jgi:hypothetical protein
MSDTKINVNKGNAMDIDLDVFEKQIDMEIDRLFPVPSSSIEWREKIRKTPLSGEGGTGATEPRTLRSESSRHDALPLDEEKKRSIFEKEDNAGGKEEEEFDFDAFERNVNLEIDKVFSATVEPLADTKGVPELSAAREVFQEAIDRDPFPTGGLEVSMAASAEAVSEPIVLERTYTGRADADDLKVEIEPAVEEVDSEIDFEPSGLKRSEMTVAEKPSQGVLEPTAFIPERVVEKVMIPAEPVSIGTPKRADIDAPSSLSVEAAGAQWEISEPVVQFDSAPAPPKTPGPVRSDLPPGLPQPSPSLAQACDAETKSKLIESLGVAFLTLDWDLTIENIEGLDDAIRGLEIYCRETREANSISKILRAVLQHVKTQPDLGASPLLSFISDAAGFLLSLLRSGTPPGSREKEQLNQLMERLQTLKVKGGGDVNGEIPTGVKQAVMTAMETEPAPALPGSEVKGGISSTPGIAPIDENEGTAESKRSAEIPFMEVQLPEILATEDAAPASGSEELTLDSPSIPFDEPPAHEISASEEQSLDLAATESMGGMEAVEPLEPEVDFAPPEAVFEPEIQFPMGAAMDEPSAWAQEGIEPDQAEMQIQRASDLAEPSEGPESGEALDLTLPLPPQSKKQPAEVQISDYPVLEPTESEEQLIRPSGERFETVEPSLLDTGTGEASDVQPMVSDTVESNDLAWLFESVDIAFVSLEWDSTTENIESLGQAIRNLEPFHGSSREASLITRVLNAVLEHIQDEPACASLPLFDFISNALEFLKLCIRTPAEQPHRKREQLRLLINRLRAMDGRTGASPLGIAEAVPDRAQCGEADEMLLLLDSLDIAYLSLYWSFNVENVAALDRAIVDLDAHSRKSRGASSIARLLKAVLRRLRARPDSVSPSLLTVISDAVQYFKLHLRAGNDLEMEDRDRLKSLLQRLRVIKSEGTVEEDGADMQPSVSLVASAGDADHVAQPMIPGMVAAVSAKSVEEFRQWLESRRRWLCDTVQSLDGEIKRLQHLEGVLAKKPVLAPVVARLSQVRLTLSEHTASCRQGEQEWNGRFRQLLEWERCFSVLPSLDVEPLPESQSDISPANADESMDVELELMDEPASLVEEKEPLNVWKEQVCLFDLAGERMAVPASSVVKFTAFSGKRAKKFLDRGYVTLADLKSLFQDLKSGLMGSWNNLPAKDLKSYRFLPVPRDLLCAHGLSSKESAGADSASPPPPARAVEGIMLVSNARSHGMILTESASMDLRNETIEAVADDEASLGVIRTESQPPVRVLNVDAFLRMLDRSGSKQS